MSSQIETLMNQIKILSKNLKEFELTSQYYQANQVLDEILNLLKQKLNEINNKEDSHKYLNILLNSYNKKKDSYEYFQYVNEKKLLVKQKMTEKYLGRRNKKEDIENNINQPIENTKIGEFEVIASSTSPQNIIKEIIEICSSLIKYYELQVESSIMKNMSIKPIQSFESFYVYDYQKNPQNVSNYNMIENYIEEIKFIKTECEKIVDSDNQINLNTIKSLEKQIYIIKEEFQKLYPKYISLKTILEKNKLVKAKSNDKK